MHIRGLIVAAGAALSLAACGTTPAPGSGETPVLTAPTGPMRTVSAQPTAADGGLECPTSITDQLGMTVPQKPQGLDGNARLLPDRDPETLVVCSYPVLDIMNGSVTSPYALKKRTLTTPAERAKVIEMLAWAPRGDDQPKMCTQMAGNETVHLVGARYDGAIVWVATRADANTCSNSTNGDFVSSAALGVALDAMFGDRDPVASPTDPCLGWSMGRLGDDQSLAPSGEPEVTVCRSDVSGARHPSALTADQSREVVAALQALKTRPTGHSCQGADATGTGDFDLVLSYDRGPNVTIRVSPTCSPALIGSALESTNSDEVNDLVALIEQWSKPIPGPDKNGSVSSDGQVAPDGSSQGGPGGIVPPDQTSRSR